MATEKEKKERLVRFLDKKAFDPVIKKNESEFKDDHEREMFKDVRRSTQSEKERFHERYDTAKDVKDNYLSDLTSETAKKKNKELEKLNLPKLRDLKEEFLKLCDQLDVK